MKEKPMLTASNIAAALGVSLARAYTALLTPFPLPYILAPTSPKGGGQTKLFTIGVVLPRLKSAFNPTPDQIRRLFKEGGYNV